MGHVDAATHIYFFYEGRNVGQNSPFLYGVTVKLHNRKKNGKFPSFITRSVNYISSYVNTRGDLNIPAVSTDATNLCVLFLISEYFSVGSAMQKALYHFNEPSD